MSELEIFNQTHEEIDELEREIKRLHRINALHKAQLRK